VSEEGPTFVEAQLPDLTTVDQEELDAAVPGVLDAVRRRVLDGVYGPDNALSGFTVDPELHAPRG
jgi:hypothetical protein